MNGGFFICCIFPCPPEILPVGDDKMKKKKTPSSGRDEAVYLCPSASWGDMTGLIPAEPDQADAAENYEELYPYRAGQTETADRV